MREKEKLEKWIKDAVEEIKKKLLVTIETECSVTF